MNRPITGRVVELFSGIQGEGLRVGERHLFLRLAGCAFGCAYCDQPEARARPETAAIERSAGARDFRRVSNPLAPAALTRLIRSLCAGRTGLHKVLAVTGGEPLHQVEFLCALLPRVRRRRLPAMLETNGVLPDALRALRGLIDIISMDLKLRSTTGRPMPMAAHARFLREAVRSNAEVHVKVVVGSATTSKEMRRAARLVARVSRSVPVVLQPVTLIRRGGPEPPPPDSLLALQETASAVLHDVRVIPQTHKLIGQR